MDDSVKPRAFDVLLIGGGVAAARCARALRRAGFGGTTALVGEEPIPPYNRPPLSKELLREGAPDALVLAEPQSWYARRSVELLLGTPVTRLDPGSRVAELADGTRLSYKHCLLATGASARRPELPGADGILLLRSLADAQALRARAVPGGDAVVIGGGFIGVEVSASLAALGMRVTLLCGSNLLWNGTFGRKVSDWAAARLTEAGVRVRFGTLATRVEPGAVTVAAERLAAHVVVAGVGVAPRTELAAGAGLEVDDGILVDGQGATQEPGVLAAGDAARTRGLPRVEHWHAARESGERAGLAIAGAPVPDSRVPWVFSEFAGAKLDAVGHAEPGDEEVEIGAGVIGFARGDVLVQVVVLGGAVPVEAARALVERGGTPADLAGMIATA